MNTNFPTYLNFDLQIVPVRNAYQIQVLDAPAGRPYVAFKNPFTPAKLVAFVQQIQALTLGVATGEPAFLKESGGDLYNALFHGEVLACLQGSLGKAKEQNANLRIRLRLDYAPELVSLPWEYPSPEPTEIPIPTSTDTPSMTATPTPLPTRSNTPRATLQEPEVIATPSKQTEPTATTIQPVAVPSTVRPTISATPRQTRTKTSTATPSLQTATLTPTRTATPAATPIPTDTATPTPNSIVSAFINMPQRVKAVRDLIDLNPGLAGALIASASEYPNLVENNLVPEPTPTPQPTATPTITLRPSETATLTVQPTRTPTVTLPTVTPSPTLLPLRSDLSSESPFVYRIEIDGCIHKPNETGIDFKQVFRCRDFQES